MSSEEIAKAVARGLKVGWFIKRRSELLPGDVILGSASELFIVETAAHDALRTVKVTFSYDALRGQPDPEFWVLRPCEAEHVAVQYEGDPDVTH